MGIYAVKNFRRFLSYNLTVVCWMVVELTKDGGISSNGYMSLIGISGIYFGTVAWDKVTAHKNGKGKVVPGA